MIQKYHHKIQDNYCIKSFELFAQLTQAGLKDKINRSVINLRICGKAFRNKLLTTN